MDEAHSYVEKEYKKGSAGLLYLIAGIFGGFADAYVPGKVYAPGDAATTAATRS